MKTKLFWTLVLTLLTISCGLNKEEKINRKVRTLAEPAAQYIASGIREKVEDVASAEGALGAISFCSVHAIPITDTLTMASASGIEIKRTSTKYRNPANAPDEFEKVALAYFQEARDNGNIIPADFIQKVNRNNQEYFEYYKPLVIQGSCLTCHASSDLMEQNVVDILEDNYPGDLATGYETGDLRGAIRVSVPASMVN